MVRLQYNINISTSNLHHCQV